MAVHRSFLPLHNIESTGILGNSTVAGRYRDTTSGYQIQIICPVTQNGIFSSLNRWI